METLKEVSSVMSELHSGYGSSLYSALIMIRTTFIKSRSALTQLVQSGAVKLLIQLLEDRRRHVNQTKITDILMSILANMCMEEDIRGKVVCCEGLSVIARVTLSSEQESIQNRGVRALANLALDVTNCEKLFDLEVPAFVAKRLMETEDVECRSTYCRALQLFGQTGKDVKRLMEETQAIQALAALLKLDNRKLALKSLRILSELSALRCCPSFTGQMLSANILEELVTLADDDDNSTASCSLSIILRLCEQEIMRPALGSAGVISLLVKLMKSDRSFVNKVWTLNALCLCTKEAVNRNKIQETGGLELFISALNERGTSNFSEGQFSVLYDRIISSLVNFLYNDDCLMKLLELGLVRILTDHLKRSCTFTSLNEDFRNEIGIFAVSLNTNVTENKARLMGEDITTETDGLNSNNIYLEDKDEHSDSTSLGEYSRGAVPDPSERGKFETGTHNPTYGDQINETYQKLCNEKLKANDEEVEALVANRNIVTNNDEMVTDSEDENSGATDLELPFQQTNRSQHTFSINSPTYEMESSWRLEDYTSGMTCKSFGQEQETSRLTPHHSSSYSGLLQAPYSPLSAGASYYSPSQSSPSHSGLLSPLQSTIPSSPTSTPYRSSPPWSFSSPENQNSPDRLYSPDSTRGYSPLSLPYQNQFSPLTNNFPDSPLLVDESHSQSPSQSSQASLFSQDALDQHVDSSDNARATEHIDRLLTASREASTSGIMFAVVPLSQDTVAAENIYSASEEDDDDAYTDVDNELMSSPLICECNENSELCQKLGSCSKKENGLSVPKSPNERCKSAHKTLSPKRSLASIQDKSSCTENSKRRRLSNNTSAVRGTSKVGYHSSGDIIPDHFSSDDEEIIKLTPDHTVTNSSNTLILQKDDVHLEVTSSGMKTDEMYTQQESQRPSSVNIHCTLVSDNLKKSFQRTASYPGKGKWPVKDSYFRKHFSAAVSPSSRLGMSHRTSTLSVSKYAAAAIISDSPYRSPFPEHVYNSTMNNENLKINVETTATTKDATDIRSRELFANMSTMQEKSSTISKRDDFEVKDNREKGTSIKTDSSTNASSDPNTHTRVKKIHRTTEINILVLLARISVKTIPTHLISESTVISCLLGYVASASNPIRRSCRILHRLCSNPHCFEKLILMQMPAMLVKSLVLEKDGSFPHDIFSTTEVKGDLLLSSQGSECSGSQTSEFGRKLDFEFGDDAYSRMTRKNSTMGSIFQNRPNVFGDSEATRDGLNGGDDIYEAGSSRLETRIRIGLGLLHTIGAVAMTKFGEGEIQHLLMRRSAQDKLACIISMLHLRVGWCHATRHQYFTKYSLCEKILPCLFTPEAPLVREVIVAAISLNIHLENPPKLTQKILKLPVCADVKSERDCNTFLTVFDAESMNEFSDKHSNSVMKSKDKLSLRNAERDSVSTARSRQFEPTYKKLITGLCHWQGSKNAALNFQEGKSSDPTTECSSDTTSLCPYQNLSHNHDVQFFIQENDGVIHKLSSHRRTLMKKSEVFGAMFCGSYSESTQSEIPIQDVDRDAFEFVIHYLHGCSSGCSVIDSLSLAGIKGEIVTSEVPISSHSAEKQESDSAMQLNDHESDIKVSSDDKNNSLSFKLNDSTWTLHEDGSKNIGSSMKTRLRTETSAYTSPMLELTQSQDSLDNLSLDDSISGTSKTLCASRKLTFQNSQVDDGSKDIETSSVNRNELNLDRNEELSGTPQEYLDELISRCENILTLADRYLLKDLVCFPTSILSHVCLCPNTVKDIFHLACFYKLDSLAFDCIRETLMSCLPCSDAAAIYLDLARDGYREQVHMTLTWLLKYMQSD